MANQQHLRNYSDGELFTHRPLHYVGAIMHFNYRHDLHTHDFYEVNIILRGEGQHYIEDSHCDVSEGHVFIIPPMIRHGYDQPNNPDVIHVLIRTSFLERYAMELRSLPGFHALFEIEPALRSSYDPSIFLRLTKEQLSGLLPTWEALHDACCRGDDVPANALTLLLIARLCACAWQRGGEDASADGRTLVIACMEYLRTHLAERIALHDLTERFHVSRSALLRRFRQVSGESPMRYLLRCRVERAAELLKTTDVPIAQVASACGFFDQSHLARAFREAQGVTPMQYRKAVKAV